MLNTAELGNLDLIKPLWPKGSGPKAGPTQTLSCSSSSSYPGWIYVSNLITTKLEPQLRNTVSADNTRQKIRNSYYNPRVDKFFPKYLTCLYINSRESPQARLFRPGR